MEETWAEVWFTIEPAPMPCKAVEEVYLFEELSLMAS
jgi:hypothetical protein